jgi:hypothetical protein
MASKAKTNKPLSETGFGIEGNMKKCLEKLEAAQQWG